MWCKFLSWPISLPSNVGVCYDPATPSGCGFDLTPSIVFQPHIAEFVGGSGRTTIGFVNLNGLPTRTAAPVQGLPSAMLQERATATTFEEEKALALSTAAGIGAASRGTGFSDVPHLVDTQTFPSIPICRSFV